MVGFLSMLPGLLSGSGGIMGAIKDVAGGALSDLAAGKLNSLGDVGKSLLSHGIGALKKNILGTNAADGPAATVASGGMNTGNAADTGSIFIPGATNVEDVDRFYELEQAGDPRVKKYERYSDMAPFHNNNGGALGDDAVAAAVDKAYPKKVGLIRGLAR